MGSLKCLVSLIYTTFIISIIIYEPYRFKIMPSDKESYTFFWNNVSCSVLNHSIIQNRICNVESNIKLTNINTTFDNNFINMHCESYYNITINLNCNNNVIPILKICKNDEFQNILNKFNIGTNHQMIYHRRNVNRLYHNFDEVETLSLYSIIYAILLFIGFGIFFTLLFTECGNKSCPTF
jgi:hypothetical protein